MIGCPNCGTPLACGWWCVQCGHNARYCEEIAWHRKWQEENNKWYYNEALTLTVFIGVVLLITYGIGVIKSYFIT